MAAVAMERVASFLVKDAPEIRRTLIRALVFGLPVLFLRFTNDPFTVPKMALLIVGVGAVLGLRISELAQGRAFVMPRFALIPLAAVVLPLTIGWLFGPYKNWSLYGEYGRFQGLVPYLLLAVFAVLAAEAFAGRLRELAWPLVAAGGVAGGYAVLQFIGLDPFAWGQQFGGEATQTSTIGNPNFYGGFFGIVLPVAVGLWLTEEERPHHALGAGALVFAGLVLSFSQGAWGAGFAGALVIGAFYLRDRWSWAPMAAIVCVLLLMIALTGRVALEMMRTDVDSASTEQLRALWWQGALNMAKDNPLVGRGPNAYAVEAPQYRSAADAQVMGFDTANDPHSVPLFFLTSAGILGLIGFLVLVGWIFLRGRWLAGSATDDLVAAGLFAGACGYLVQSVVAIDELTVRFGLWTCIAGIAAAGSVLPQEASPAPIKKGKKKGRLQQTAPRLNNPAAVGIGVLVSLLGLWFGMRFLMADASFRSGVTATLEGRVDDAVESLDKATAARGDYHYRHHQGVHLGQLARALERADRDGSGLFRQSLQAFSYLGDFPDVPGWVDRSRLLRSYAEADGSWRDEAAASYMKALSFDPFNTTLISETAEALWFAREWESLIEVATSAEGSNSAGGLDAYLAVANAHLGNEEAAAAVLARLGEAAETDPIAVEAQEILEEAP
jgi:O-antigen ligase